MQSKVQWLRKIRSTLSVVAEVVSDAAGGMLCTCAVVWCIFGFMNSVWQVVIPVLTLVVLLSLVIMGMQRLQSKCHFRPSKDYKDEHSKILQAPRLFYASMILFELLFFVLGVHSTVIMHMPSYQRIQSVVATLDYDEDTTALCVILRGLPAPLTYILIETSDTVADVKEYVTDNNIDISTPIGSLPDADGNFIAESVTRLDGVLRVSQLQSLLIAIFWILFGVCRYPGKVFNRYVRIKKSEEDTN